MIDGVASSQVPRAGCGTHDAAVRADIARISKAGIRVERVSSIIIIRYFKGSELSKLNLRSYTWMYPPSTWGQSVAIVIIKAPSARHCNSRCRLYLPDLLDPQCHYSSLRFIFQYISAVFARICLLIWLGLTVMNSSWTSPAFILYNMNNEQ